MGIQIQLSAFILGLMFLVWVMNALKHGKIKASYAFLWLLMCAYFMTIPMSSSLYKWISLNVVGMEEPNHFIYVVVMVFLLVYIFHLTTKITQLKDQVQALITHLAILRKDFDEQNKKN